MGTKLLLLLHALVALALVGAATHGGLLGIAGLRGRVRHTRLDRTYSQVVFWLYLSSLMLGAVLYPSFRVDVRAAYLDHAMPMGTRLFELKEHLIVFGLFGVFVQRGLGHLEERSPNEALLFDLSRIFLMTVVSYSALVGLLLVSVRSV